jgi:integrase
MSAKFSVLLKGSRDKNRPDFVKITMVIYKPGYPRVPKILPITGLYKNWDQAEQRFKPKTKDASELNSQLADVQNDYIRVANSWEQNNVNWTPKQLSAYYKKPREVMLRETVIPTVEQMFKIKIAELYANKRIKNGHEISSNNYAKIHEKVLEFLKKFTVEKFSRSFSNYHFTDITADFLRQYVMYIEEQGAKKGNKGGLRNKLNVLYMIVDKARRRGVPGADLEQFDCTNDKFRASDSVPKTVDYRVILALENLDRSQITELEAFHIDLFLFCFYCGGMAPVDASYLTWPCVDLMRRKITYERVKYPKKARPPFFPRAEKIAEKYRSQCAGDYVLPIYNRVNMTESQRRSRMGYMDKVVNETLRRVKGIIGYEGELFWYSARGTYITFMLERKYDPGVVAEHCGNSVLTIYKNYFKNLKEAEIIAELCEEFAA